MTKLLTEHPVAGDLSDHIKCGRALPRARRRHSEPRRMLCTHRPAVADAHLISSRVLNTTRRCTESRASRRSIACASIMNAQSPAAQWPPSLARTLTAFSAAAVLSISVIGPCHANELFQKTCAGAPL